jgi:hypothetical protein
MRTQRSGTLRHTHGSCECLYGQLLSTILVLHLFHRLLWLPRILGVPSSVLGVIYFLTSSFLPFFMNMFYPNAVLQTFLTLCPIINHFMVWSLSFIRASSLALPIESIVSSLFFF